jgi:hypothetical protein
MARKQDCNGRNMGRQPTGGSERTAQEQRRSPVGGPIERHAQEDCSSHSDRVKRESELQWLKFGVRGCCESLGIWRLLACWQLRTSRTTVYHSKNPGARAETEANPRPKGSATLAEPPSHISSHTKARRIFGLLSPQSSEARSLTIRHKVHLALLLPARPPTFPLTPL